MRRFRLSMASLAMLAITLLAACASGGGLGQGDAAATVVVNNNLAVPTSLTVSVLPESGVRRLLGSVAPGRSSTLPYSGPITGGQYRLHARNTAGQDMISDPFSFSMGAQVTWDIQSNIIRVGTP